MLMSSPHCRRLPGNSKGHDVVPDPGITDMEEDGEEEPPGILVLNKCVENNVRF